MYAGILCSHFRLLFTAILNRQLIMAALKDGRNFSFVCYVVRIKVLSVELCDLSATATV